MGIDPKKDRDSAIALSVLLENEDRIRSLFEKARSVFEDRLVVIFGAGPSLASDIEGLSDTLERKPAVVAADGAADALRERDVRFDAVVSDLDSCSEDLLRRTSEEHLLFVHAHGDNLNLVESIVPKLGPNVVGTTQVRPFGNLTNFGGFTDGDRACFIAAHFRPKVIVISGMDFGPEEGEYSRNRYSGSKNAMRDRKLDWGKKSIGLLIQMNPNTKFWNVTRFGLEIDGAPKVSYERLARELS